MSRKSPKQKQIGNPNSIANAMYDAQKKEITSSMVLSLSFIGAGLIVAIVGIFQFLHVRGSVNDSAESYDAGAWLVIAGVGMLVGVIGLISVMKSFVSLGQIDNWAKEAESHASPFQGQKVTRKVAAMNQSQAMEKAAAMGMAEENGQKKRRGFFNRVKETKGKEKNEDLYYKYNPQKKPEAPQKSAPVMEQKFDYGIHEEKQLTFADEFLKKNKRDPFAQYRKDLGLQEESDPVYEQKPKFVVNNKQPAAPSAPTPVLTPLKQEASSSNTANAAAPAKHQATQTESMFEKSSFPSFMSDEMEQGMELNFGLSYDKDEDQKEEFSSKDESTPDYMSLLDNFAPKEEIKGKSESKPKNEPATDFDTAVGANSDSEFFDKIETQPEPALEPESESAFEIESKPENTAKVESYFTAVSSPYGTHNEDDDDMFFSAKANKADFVQKSSSKHKQQNNSSSTFTPDKGSYISQKAASEKKKTHLPQQ